jgi:PAS domain S-box-containing protein
LSETTWHLASRLFDQAGEALVLFDPDTGQILNVNATAQRLSGYEAGRLLQMNLGDLLPAWSPTGGRTPPGWHGGGAHAPLRASLHRHPNGLVPVEVVIAPVTAAHTALCLLIARDLRGQSAEQIRVCTLEEDLRRAETALREGAAQLQILTEQTPAILWTTDRELRILSGLGAGLAGLNLKPGQLNGTSLYAYLRTTDETLPPIAAHHRALAGEPTTYDFVWEGRAFHCHVEPLRDAEGQVTGTIGIARDITERKQAEDRLHEVHAFLDSVFENIPHMIFIKDAHTLRYENLNTAAERLLGCRREDLIGKTDFDLFPRRQADFFRATDEEILRSKELLDIPGEIVVTPDGERILHTKKIPLLDGQGNPRHLLAIAEDITERRRLEEQLRQAHKMEAVGRLAGGVAHDFNNLLTTILGGVALTLNALPPDHPCRELLVNAERAGRRAADLTRQLLDFSRQRVSRPVAHDLNTTVEETVRLLRRTVDPRITVRTETEPALWPVAADPGQMHQLLMNLCLNARDAMPEGGSLSLETANVTLDSEHARARFEGRPGEFVRLRVQDTGQGMPAEVRQHIFEPFFTTKEFGKGTGLGLAVVFGIVKQHQGWIECTSAVDRGTCFDIYLPRGVGPAAVPSPPAAPVRGGQETILLVDDQEMIRELGERILQPYGYHVLTAADGVEALRLYRRWSQVIDLVILDLLMPGLSGLETLRELRQIKPDVRVLISSGYYADKEGHAPDCNGAVGRVSKPYHPEQLARAVRLALDGMPVGSATGS